MVLDSPRSARAAGLRYVSDQQPRESAGSGRPRRFRYVDASGRRIVDKSVLQRIHALAIPPAWTGVWICAQADGHLQATGRDARGRKQYRYHPRWRVVRDEVKYGRLVRSPPHCRGSEPERRRISPEAVSLARRSWRRSCSCSRKR